MTANAYGLRLLAQARVQVAALVVLAVVVLSYRALQFVAWTGQVQWGYDFSYYWTAAAHLLHGEPIYSAQQLAGQYAPQAQEGFLYPPPLAALVMPLAALFPSDYRAAAWLWTGLGAAILVASVLAVARTEQLGERYPLLAGRRRWLLVAAAFAFPPVVGELVLGNVHLLLLGLLTLAWLGIRRGDDRGEVMAGLAIGVAALIKLFPVLLVIWLLATGRRRAAAFAVIGAIGVSLATLPFTGIEPWLQYPTVLANLSAPADTKDTLAPTVWLAPLLGFTIARIAILVLAVVIVVVAARSITDPARSFGAAVVASVLVAPALYHHYLAILVLPLLLGLAGGVGVRWLAAAYFLMWGGQQAALGDLAWLGNRGAPTAGALALLVATFRNLRWSAVASGTRSPGRRTAALGAADGSTDKL